MKLNFDRYVDILCQIKAHKKLNLFEYDFMILLLLLLVDC